MFEGAFSPVHILIVGVVALLVLGPDKLPGAARTAAKAWRELQEMRNALVGDMHDLADEVIPPETSANQPRAQTPAAEGPAPIDVGADPGRSADNDAQDSGGAVPPSPRPDRWEG